MAWTAGVDVTTGDLITAAQWNSYLGTSGSLNHLDGLLDTCSFSSPARSLDTIYQNTTGKLLLVTVNVELDDGDGVYAHIGVASPPWGDVGEAVNRSGMAGDYWASICFLVPVNYYYRVWDSLGTPTLRDWHEYLLH